LAATPRLISLLRTAMAAVGSIGARYQRQLRDPWACAKGA
jgi:hypothetical protein